MREAEVPSSPRITLVKSLSSPCITKVKVLSFQHVTRDKPSNMDAEISNKVLIEGQPA